MLEGSDIKLLSKPGKHPLIVSSYRPISILNPIGKVFEKVVNKLLLDEVSSRGLLHSNQFGFHAGFSVEGTVLKLVSKLNIQGSLVSLHL